MSSIDDTEERAYFTAGGWKRDLGPPRVKIDQWGMVDVQPFGIGGVDLSFAVGVERWREIVTLAERAIAEAEIPAVAS